MELTVYAKNTQTAIGQIFVLLEDFFKVDPQVTVFTSQAVRCCHGCMEIVVLKDGHSNEGRFYQTGSWPPPSGIVFGQAGEAVELGTARYGVLQHQISNRLYHYDEAVK